MKTSNIMIFQLDSDKQSFGLDNVPTIIRIEAAIIKIQCFENKSDFLCSLNENMSVLEVLYSIVLYHIGIPWELHQIRTLPWLRERYLTCDQCHYKRPIF